MVQAIQKFDFPMVRTIIKMNKFAAILFLSTIENRTDLYHSNSEHVWNSNPHCAAHKNPVFGLLLTVVLAQLSLFSYFAGNKAKARAIEEGTAWKTALDRSSGVKVKDDPTLLKRSIKKQERKKKLTKQKWESRYDDLNTTKRPFSNDVTQIWSFSAPTHPGPSCRARVRLYTQCDKSPRQFPLLA